MEVEASNADKNIPWRCYTSEDHSNAYDSFYTKLRNDDGNPNQSQQHLDLDTSSNLLNDTFVPLVDDTLTLVTGKQIEGHEN